MTSVNNPKDVNPYVIPWNDVFRAALAGSLSIVPEVGSLLSKLTEALWPQTTPPAGLPMDQLQQLMDQMMLSILDQTAVTSLKNGVNGLNQNLVDYANATSQAQRQSTMQFLISESSFLKATYYDDARPWATFTYIVQFANIRLGILREEVLFYEDIYGQPDNNPAKTLDNLRSEIIYWQGKVQSARQQALTWRLSCITITKETSVTVGTSTTYSQTVADTYLSYSKTWQTVSHSGSNNDPDQVNLAAADYSNRENEINKSYAAGLDDDMAISLLWPYLDPTKNPPGTTLPMHTQWWYQRLGRGYNSGGNIAFDDEQFMLTNGLITSVTIWSGDWIDGIEVFYGGKSSGLRGSRNGNPYTVTINSGDGLSGWGAWCGDIVTNFHFMTIQGKWVGPDYNPNPNMNLEDTPVQYNTWELATGPPYTANSPQIVYLFGRAAGNRVDEIGLAWRTIMPFSV